MNCRAPRVIKAAAGPRPGRAWPSLAHHGVVGVSPKTLESRGLQALDLGKDNTVCWDEASLVSAQGAPWVPWVHGGTGGVTRNAHEDVEEQEAKPTIQNGHSEKKATLHIHRESSQLLLMFLENLFFSLLSKEAFLRNVFALHWMGRKQSCDPPRKWSCDTARGPLAGRPTPRRPPRGRPPSCLRVV